MTPEIFDYLNHPHFISITNRNFTELTKDYTKSLVVIPNNGLTTEL